MRALALALALALGLAVTAELGMRMRQPVESNTGATPCLRTDRPPLLRAGGRPEIPKTRVHDESFEGPTASLIRQIGECEGSAPPGLVHLLRSGDADAVQRVVDGVADPARMLRAYLSIVRATSERAVLVSSVLAAASLQGDFSVPAKLIVGGWRIHPWSEHPRSYELLEELAAATLTLAAGDIEVARALAILAGSRLNEQSDVFAWARQTSRPALVLLDFVGAMAIRTPSQGGIEVLRGFALSPQSSVRTAASSALLALGAVGYSELVARIGDHSRGFESRTEDLVAAIGPSDLVHPAWSDERLASALSAATGWPEWDARQGRSSSPPHESNSLRLSMHVSLIARLASVYGVGNANLRQWIARYVWISTIKGSVAYELGSELSLMGFRRKDVWMPELIASLDEFQPTTSELELIAACCASGTISPVERQMQQDAISRAVGRLLVSRDDVDRILGKFSESEPPR